MNIFIIFNQKLLFLLDEKEFNFIQIRYVSANIKYDRKKTYRKQTYRKQRSTNKNKMKVLKLEHFECDPSPQNS